MRSRAYIFPRSAEVDIQLRLRRQHLGSTTRLADIIVERQRDE